MWPQTARRFTRSAAPQQLPKESARHSVAAPRATSRHIASPRAHTQRHITQARHPTHVRSPNLTSTTLRVHRRAPSPVLQPIQFASALPSHDTQAPLSRFARAAAPLRLRRGRATTHGQVDPQRRAARPLRHVPRAPLPRLTRLPRRAQQPRLAPAVRHREARQRPHRPWE